MTESVPQLLDSILDRQRQALLQGLRPTIESILDNSPLADDREALLDLVYNEVVVLEELGEHPTLEQYARRYPQLEDELQVHFEVHQAVQGDMLQATDHSQANETWPKCNEDRFVPGTKFGDYELGQEIGHGGMAIVFRARDLRLHRDVALKMFRPERAPTPREALRFQTEAEAMARLTHPGIVRIFDIGRYQERPYLALELAERGNLAQQLQRTVFSPEVAARLLESLARAVDHAHQHQVIHRDLKPANILFTSDGTAKLTDFGLAKVLHDDLHSPHDTTRTGESIGTPRYMAPEQASGEHDQVGPATDVYSLGTILFECLTGKAPFVATSVLETLQMIRTVDPVSPRRLQPTIPRDLATICLHCLEKAPDRRYPTALALADDLLRFQRGEPIKARAISAGERVWKWCRRRPAHAALVAVGLLFTVASLAFSVIGRYANERRLQQLRSDVAGLVSDGQRQLERGESDLAYGRFHKAWMIVQAEPAMEDHRPGIGGWLDHSRRALSQQQWKQRLPPREFDDRRDQALLESLLLDGQTQEAISLARDSIHAALELTIPADPAWQSQRLRLVLAEADLIARQVSAEAAAAYLESLSEFPLRLFHEQRARFLSQAGDSDEAKFARQEALLFPIESAETLLFTGMDRIRRRDFATALNIFDQLLILEPENYTGRLFQAICFLNLNRYGEARVALTACIAQRPQLYCNHFFRAQAMIAIGDSGLAIQDLKRVLELNPSPAMHAAADSLLAEAQRQIAASVSNVNTDKSN